MPTPQPGKSLRPRLTRKAGGKCFALTRSATVMDLLAGCWFIRSDRLHVASANRLKVRTSRNVALDEGPKCLMGDSQFNSHPVGQEVTFVDETPELGLADLEDRGRLLDGEEGRGRGRIGHS